MDTNLCLALPDFLICEMPGCGRTRAVRRQGELLGRCCERCPVEHSRSCTDRNQGVCLALEHAVEVAKSATTGGDPEAAADDASAPAESALHAAAAVPLLGDPETAAGDASAPAEPAAATAPTQGFCPLCHEIVGLTSMRTPFDCIHSMCWPCNYRVLMHAIRVCPICRAPVPAWSPRRRQRR